MTATQEPQFTVPEIRCAIEVTRLGRAYDVPEPLRSLAEELVQRCQYVYRITDEDLTTYLDDCLDLNERQQTFFLDRARKYIDNSDAFGESLQICLELAYTDALGEAEEK